MSLSPIAPPEADLPPWSWNPAATFQTSFLAAREEQRAQQEFQMNMELEKILFPLKVQTAQMNFEKLVQDRDRTMMLNEQIRQARRNASEGIKSAIGGSGVAGGNAAQPQGAYQSRFGFGSKITTTPQPSQATTRKVGSGVMPKQP